MQKMKFLGQGLQTLEHEQDTDTQTDTTETITTAAFASSKSIYLSLSTVSLTSFVCITLTHKNDITSAKCNPYDRIRYVQSKVQNSSVGLTARQRRIKCPRRLSGPWPDYSY